MQLLSTFVCTINTWFCTVERRLVLALGCGLILGCLSEQVSHFMTLHSSNCPACNHLNSLYSLDVNGGPAVNMILLLRWSIAVISIRSNPILLLTPYAVDHRAMGFFKQQHGTLQFWLILHIVGIVGEQENYIIIQRLWVKMGAWMQARYDTQIPVLNDNFI